MNVTIKMDDALCKQARHRAVDVDLSLSGWIARVVEKELSEANVGEQTLADAIGMEDDRDLMEFVPDRKLEADRPIEFP